MKRYSGFGLLLCLVMGSGATLLAQGVMPPPKVLVVMREFIKPGKSGSLHEKTESAFVQAMTAAKWPTHYLGMDSMSGASRSLFFVGYDSFADWEKDNLATMRNATLSAALDRASIADGELLTGYQSSAFGYREDMSLRAPVNIAQMRYFQILRFKIKPGHLSEWEALVKLYHDGYEKGVPDARWATYEAMFGQESDGLYIVLIPMKSLAEVDAGLGDAKKFFAALGDDGVKRLADLTGACVEASEANLFAFNPKLSYVSGDWVKADPAFWSPKTAAPIKKPAEKPAQ